MVSSCGITVLESMASSFGITVLESMVSSFGITVLESKESKEIDLYSDYTEKINYRCLHSQP